ncbi:MAG: ABC-2 family transporter protein [Chloroflexi bacterium]|nr:ABC-2 family transporter protein [Chloroflexota bacterium]
MRAGLRRLRPYLALGAVVIKRGLQYRLQFWTGLFGQIVLLVAYVAFWRAVYAGHASLGGLSARQTITYILIARCVSPLLASNIVEYLGFYLRFGYIATELTRPVDLQAKFYVERLSGTAMLLLQQTVPVALLSAVFFGLRLPADPWVWAAFALSLLAGYTVLFLLDWLIACLAFYTTQTSGLSTMRDGVTTFFSGALIPLALFPGPLRAVADVLPFAQALYAPVGLLSGIIAPQAAGRALLIQAAWLAALLVLSRLAFTRGLRALAVQGG